MSSSSEVDERENMPNTQVATNSTKQPAQKPVATRPVSQPSTPGRSQVKPMISRHKVSASKKNSQSTQKVSGKKVASQRHKLRVGLHSPQLIWRLVVAMVLGVGFAAGAIYSHGQLEKLVSDISQKKAQYIALSQKEEDYQLLSSGLAVIKTEALLIQEAFPDEAGLVEFLSQVEILRKEQGIEVSTFSFTTDQPQKDRFGNDYVELSIEASGPLTNLEKFTDGLLKLPLMIRLKVIKLEKVSEPNSRLVLKAWVFVQSDFFNQSQK